MNNFKYIGQNTRNCRIPLVNRINITSLNATALFHFLLPCQLFSLSSLSPKIAREVGSFCFPLEALCFPLRMLKAESISPFEWLDLLFCVGTDISIWYCRIKLKIKTHTWENKCHSYHKELKEERKDTFFAFCFDFLLKSNKIDQTKPMKHRVERKKSLYCLISNQTVTLRRMCLNKPLPFL